MSTTIKIAIKTVQQQAKPLQKSVAPSPYCRDLPAILAKIKEYIKDVDSGMDDSLHSWAYLKALYLKLYDKKNLSPTDKELLAFIEPIVLKHGSYDGKLSAVLEGQHFNRVSESDIHG